MIRSGYQLKILYIVNIVFDFLLTHCIILECISDYWLYLQGFSKNLMEENWRFSPHDGFDLSIHLLPAWAAPTISTIFYICFTWNLVLRHECMLNEFKLKENIDGDKSPLRNW